MSYEDDDRDNSWHDDAVAALERVDELENLLRNFVQNLEPLPDGLSLAQAVRILEHKRQIVHAICVGALAAAAGEGAALAEHPAPTKTGWLVRGWSAPQYIDPPTPTAPQGASYAPGQLPRLDEPDYWHSRGRPYAPTSRDELTAALNRPGSRQLAVVGPISEQTRAAFSGSGALLLRHDRPLPELVAAHDRYVFGVLACGSDWADVLRACVVGRKRCFALPPGTNASPINVSRFLATARPEDFYMITADARKILDTVKWDYYHAPTINQHTVSVVLPDGRQKLFSAADAGEAAAEAARWLASEADRAETPSGPSI